MKNILIISSLILSLNVLGGNCTPRNNFCQSQNRSTCQNITIKIKPAIYYGGPRNNNKTTQPVQGRRNSNIK